MPLGPDAAAALAVTLEVASPTGRSTRAVEPQVTRHRLDFPGGDDIAPAVRTRRRRRQPHVNREARQAPSAPPRPRLPPLGMHRRKRSAEQPLVPHDAVPDSRSAVARPLRSISLSHRQQRALNRRLTVHATRRERREAPFHPVWATALGCRRRRPRSARSRPAGDRLRRAAAYARSDLLERRRHLMDDGAKYVAATHRQRSPTMEPAEYEPAGTAAP